MKKNEQNQRREMITLGMIAGVGILSGTGIKKIILDNTTAGQKVKMMTSKGELVEVDARHLPKKREVNPISNAELRKWIDNENI